MRFIPNDDPGIYDFSYTWFIYIILSHTKKLNYPDPKLCIMTYARFAMNVKIYPIPKVKDELIVKSKTCGNGIFVWWWLWNIENIKMINSTIIKSFANMHFSIWLRPKRLDMGRGNQWWIKRWKMNEEERREKKYDENKWGEEEKRVLEKKE